MVLRWKFNTFCISKWHTQCWFLLTKALRRWQTTTPPPTFPVVCFNFPLTLLIGKITEILIKTVGLSLEVYLMTKTLLTREQARVLVPAGHFVWGLFAPEHQVVRKLNSQRACKWYGKESEWGWWWWWLDVIIAWGIPFWRLILTRTWNECEND